VHRTMIQTLTIVGLVLSTSSIATASPAIRLLDGGSVPQAKDLERVDFNWNHHHYHHRSWDKKHGHWHYFD
jgi:hypothetical protein